MNDASAAVSVEEVLLHGEEISAVLESWGYYELARSANEHLRQHGEEHQVELSVAHVPDRMPLLLDESLTYIPTYDPAELQGGGAA